MVIGHFISRDQMPTSREESPANSLFSNASPIANICGQKHTHEKRRQETKAEDRIITGEIKKRKLTKKVHTYSQSHYSKGCVLFGIRVFPQVQKMFFIGNCHSEAYRSVRKTARYPAGPHHNVRSNSVLVEYMLTQHAPLPGIPYKRYRTQPWNNLLQYSRFRVLHA